MFDAIVAVGARQRSWPTGVWAAETGSWILISIDYSEEETLPLHSDLENDGSGKRILCESNRRRRASVTGHRWSMNERRSTATCTATCTVSCTATCSDSSAATWLGRLLRSYIRFVNCSYRILPWVRRNVDYHRMNMRSTQQKKSPSKSSVLEDDLKQEFLRATKMLTVARQLLAFVSWQWCWQFISSLNVCTTETFVYSLLDDWRNKKAHETRLNNTAAISHRKPLAFTTTTHIMTPPHSACSSRLANNSLLWTVLE